MKIRLSEDEVYEIKMPEEIGIEEFPNIVAKFNFLIKHFTKFNIKGEEINQGEILLTGNVANSVRKKYDKEKWPTLKENRDILISLLKAHYLLDLEGFNKFIKDNNLNFSKIDMAGGSMIRMRELHNVKPEEVGLIKFPSRTEQIKHLKIEENENE